MSAEAGNYTTVLSLIEAGATRLGQAGVAFGHGTANAFDESAWLVLWRLGLPLDALDDVRRGHGYDPLGADGLLGIDPVGGAFEAGDEQERDYRESGTVLRPTAYLADELGDEVRDAVDQRRCHQHAGGAFMQKGGGDQQAEGDYAEGQAVQALGRWGEGQDHRQYQR